MSISPRPQTWGPCPVTLLEDGHAWVDLWGKVAISPTQADVLAVLIRYRPHPVKGIVLRRESHHPDAARVLLRMVQNTQAPWWADVLDPAQVQYRGHSFKRTWGATMPMEEDEFEFSWKR